MKWQDVYEAKPSKNARGENVFDIYRIGDKDAVWVDILADKLEEFMKGMMGITDRAAQEEFDAMFSDQTSKEQNKEEMKVEYDRLRQYGDFGGVSFEDE